MRWNYIRRYMSTFEWHDWFAWYPIENPDDNRFGRLWLETVERKRIEVGPQGLTGNYEWHYRTKQRVPQRDAK